MNTIINLPRLVFIVSFVVLWLSAEFGAFFGPRLRPLEEKEREYFGVVQAAILTLLGLLVGFAFSMAVSRYDQRKIMRKPKPTRSVRNTSGPTCCLPPLLIEFAICSGTISIIEFCSTPPATTMSWRGSTPLRLNCKRSCGPPSRLLRQRSRRLLWPSRLRA